MSHVPRWWTLATDAVASLTTPESEASAVDREFGEMLRESTVYGGVHSVAAFVRGSSARSRAASWARGAAATFRALPPAGRVRCAAASAIAASATAAAIEAAGSPEPFTWVLPLVVLAAAAVACAAAPAIARRVAREHS